ncbi:hypothetical protein, partial [Chitinimonas sp.]|uniref:hypothetical protein n=1 Tax=Chitinimonas sp. TaxID=1934313 RepID=UPI0035B25892
FAFAHQLSYTHSFRFVFVCVSSREANYTHHPENRQHPNRKNLQKVCKSLIFNISNPEDFCRSSQECFDAKQVMAQNLSGFNEKRPDTGRFSLLRRSGKCGLLA